MILSTKWKSLLLEKLSYRVRYSLIYNFNLIKIIPSLLRYINTDFSNLKMTSSNISLEASSMCQLKCPICPTSTGINKRGIVGWGYLKFKDFKKFVDNHSYIKNIELSNWGEIFLNPELKKILQYAYFKKINLTSYTGVNLNNVSEDILECLVKYKLRYLNISLDGATNKTYKIYRQGGDFNKVIRNIKLINYFKKKYSSKFPQLSWQFILMGHNIHELLAARKMANTLGMHFFFKLNNNPSYSPIVDKKLVRKISKLSVMSRKEFFQKYKRLYIPFCKQFWTSPQINWDGKLLGCCKNIYDDFGNVFDTSLKHCLNNERYIYVKQMILGKKEGRSDIPCSKCHIYPLIKRKSLKKREILRNFNII